MPTPSKSEQIAVRVADPADFAAADRLLDAAYAPYAGPIDRTRMPRRTDPASMRRFLAEDAGRPAGTATFREDGGVLDWAVPESPSSGRITEALLAAGEAWVRERGGKEILLYTTPAGAPPEESMRRLGFRSVRPPYVVMQVVHFPELLGAIAGARAATFSGLPPMTLAIHLERGLYPPLPDPDFRVRVTPAGAEILAGKGDGDATLEATATAFSEFLFGATDLDGLLAAGATISPAGSAEAARRVIGALAFGRPWFVALGERR